MEVLFGEKAHARNVRRTKTGYFFTPKLWIPTCSPHYWKLAGLRDLRLPECMFNRDNTNNKKINKKKTNSNNHPIETHPVGERPDKQVMVM